jgi:hypothetical protein
MYSAEINVTFQILFDGTEKDTERFTQDGWSPN